MSILEGIADSHRFQHGELYGDKILQILKDKFSQLNDVTKVDGLFIVDEDNIMTTHICTRRI